MGGGSGRDAVLRVQLGFPIADARQRVPTLEFFHSFGPIAKQLG